MHERIDRAIDRLDDALRVRGFAALEAPASQEALGRIAEEVAPYRLPADFGRLWERVDLASVAVFGYRMSALLDPASALLTHRMNLEEFPLLYGPPLLFPIARHSGDQWSVELASEWSEGGVVLSHDVSHRVEYPELADLVEVYAELLEEGAIDRTYGAALMLEPERAKQEERFESSWPHPLYGDTREFSRDPADWPAHWLASAGIDLATRTPLGATHTLAELVQEAERGAVTGRVVVKVVWVGGSADGVIAIVDDGVRQLDVWWPTGVSPWGPGMGGRYELELALPGAVHSPPDIASLPTMEFLAVVQRHGPAAVATDVRPVDD